MVKEAGKAERELKELSAQQKGFVAKQLAKLAGEEGGGVLEDLMQREDVLERAYERYGDRENDYAKMVMETCERNGWEYLIRFKDGSIPYVADEWNAVPERERSGAAECVNGI